MHDASAAVSYFKKMYPSWHISATEAMGLSGGIAMFPLDFIMY